LIKVISEVRVMPPGKASMSARERARASLTADIKEEARRQLAQVGADGLSLRAVARELGMVSSALYRYFPSRDELLTALIIDAYNAVGEVAEQAAGAEAARPLDRWLAACHEIRAWALKHPHEYALIYGSPVPGYRAPEATIGPASRVPLALISLLGGVGGVGSGGKGRDAGDVPIPAGLAGQAAGLATLLGGSVRPDVLLRAILAWTQLFGIISFELFGQFVGSFEPADELFEFAVRQMGSLVGM
jgi:AcrR family transcriptional regulator